MRIDIICAIPGLLDGSFSHSILHRAREAGLLDVQVHDLKAFGRGKWKQIDDYQYGGGAGMVLRCEPLYDAITSLTSQHSYDEIIFMTPDAEVLNQKAVNELSLATRLMIICGHYKGIDQRIRDNMITREISIGDYVLSGGELAAAVLVDAIGRLIPGVINDGTSALTDSHQDGLLSAPVYTRPESFHGWKVPEVLLSGHEARIAEWRAEQALKKTKSIRPDLLRED